MPITNAVIRVDLNVVTRKLASFRERRQQLGRIMEGLDNAMRLLQTAKWVSPASRMLWSKFSMLFRQCQEALRIVDEYIHDLDVVLRAYTEVESRLEGRAQGLQTDVFGV